MTMKQSQIEDIITELTIIYFVQQGPNGELLHEMDYQSLVRLLAVQRAVVE